MKKKRKNPRRIIKIIKRKLYSDRFMNTNRLSNKDFTRKRLPLYASIIYDKHNKQTLQKSLLVLCN
jgi:hypothetical protein